MNDFWLMAHKIELLNYGFWHSNDFLSNKYLIKIYIFTIQSLFTSSLWTKPELDCSLNFYKYFLIIFNEIY